MIKIENTEVLGWEHAIRGMRNPMNSWEKSDSCTQGSVWCGEFCASPMEGCDKETGLYLGPNDHDLMMLLANGGPVHAKYRRMIVVYCDILAPLYWWKEFDTYKVGTVANSCSTMHKIAAKEFTLEDFSCEHLGVTIPEYLNEGEEVYQNLWEESLRRTINDLNLARDFYIREKHPKLKKKYWWQMIQLLPSSYNQRRTVMLNYEVLAGIYPMRKDHKLDEWREFCEWIEGLPYSEIITGPDLSRISICHEIMEEAKRRVKEETPEFLNKDLHIPESELKKWAILGEEFQKRFEAGFTKAEEENHK